MKVFRFQKSRSTPTSLGATATLVAVATAAGTLIGAAVTPLVNYFTNERQMDVKMVEIGIGILRAEPKEDVAPMREWAIDVIETSSRRKFTRIQRAALLKQALPLRWDMQGAAWDESFSKGFGAGASTAVPSK